MIKLKSIFTTFSLFCLAFVVSCETDVNYSPNRPEKYSYIIYEEYLSSPRLENVQEPSQREKPGTGFEIHTQVHVKKTKSGYHIEWIPKKFDAAGYNKSLLAEVLQKKMRLDISVDSNGVVQKISGFNKMRPMVDSIKLKDPLKKRLKSRIDTNYYKNLWQDRWYISQFLPEGKYHAGQKLDTALLNPKLKTIKADSVILSAIRKKISSECLEYSVYYRTKKNLQLELEEFFVVHQKKLFDAFQFRKSDFFENRQDLGRTIKKGFLENEEVEGIWRFSVTLDEGLPCYEFKKEELKKQIADSIETKLNVTFFRTIESGFKFE